MPSFIVCRYSAKGFASAMPLERIVVEKLKHSDGKTFWGTKGNNAEVIWGERFLKLARRSIAHGFARLCIEADGALLVMGTEWSMSTFRGEVAFR